MNLIFVRLAQVESQLEKCLDATMYSKVLKYSIRVKFVVFVVVMTAINFATIAIDFSRTSLLAEIFVSLLTMCKFCVIFFFTILTIYKEFLMCSLNQHLENFYIDRFQVDEGIWDLIQLLRHIRIINFKMYKGVQQLLRSICDLDGIETTKQSNS